jgi:hypothetical protein
MEGLSLGDRSGRDDSNPSGVRSNSGSDEHRIQPAADPIGAIIGCKRVVRLQTQRIFDRDEVQQTPFGLSNEVCPVIRLEQLGWAGIGFAPRGWVPAGSVQSHGEVDGPRQIRHIALLLSDTNRYRFDDDRSLSFSTLTRPLIPGRRPPPRRTSAHLEL